jgi:hypothetical protein
VLLEAVAAADDHRRIEACEERAHERRLADARLAGDEAELAAPRLRTLQRRGQHAELRIAPDDERIDRRRLGLGADGAGLELRDEPIASPDDRLGHAFSDHLPELVHVAANGAVADHRAAPHVAAAANPTTTAFSGPRTTTAANASTPQAAHAT